MLGAFVCFRLIALQLTSLDITSNETCWYTTFSAVLHFGVVEAAVSLW